MAWFSGHSIVSNPLIGDLPTTRQTCRKSKRNRYGEHDLRAN
jgi:hypothetical protein